MAVKAQCINSSNNNCVPFKTKPGFMPGFVIIGIMRNKHLLTLTIQV